MKVEKNITLLISTGTAICGGSVIAAVASVLKSEAYQNSFALIVVFVLNASLCSCFHDTSSVVGAGAIYGERALQVATTVKLIRALWIVPLSIIFALLKGGDQKHAIKIPWFILIFVAAIVFANFFPSQN